MRFCATAQFFEPGYFETTVTLLSQSTSVIGPYYIPHSLQDAAKVTGNVTALSPDSLHSPCSQSKIQEETYGKFILRS